MIVLPEQKILRKLGNPAIAEHSLRFFKTGKGEYGEGDQFLGIRVPVLRKQAKAFQHLSLKEIQHLLHSRFHEERLCALYVLVQKFSLGGREEQAQIFNLYLNNTQYINGWDLVDSSAHQIVGQHLFNTSREILYALAKSESLWERRIAIISTHHFIREHQYSDTLKISEQLLDDNEDLIHKAVGWMLREIGNHDLTVEESFLKRHYKIMPRTMLRYAIEKFPEEKRQAFLKGLM
jgi:3-methyladenine DNA glycosylase AlkD